MEAPPGFEPGMEVCRFRRVALLNGWSCFLVRGTIRFCVVFGRFCSRIVLESHVGAFTRSLVTIMARCEAAPWTAAQVLGHPRPVGRHCGVT